MQPDPTPPALDSATSRATTLKVKRWLPWVVATALFMEQLDSTIVNTAIPSMAASLGVAPLSLKAVVTSYIHLDGIREDLHPVGLILRHHDRERHFTAARHDRE